MAGLYAVFGANPAARISGAARRLKFFDEHTEATVEQRFGCVWVGHDDPHLFAPARDPQTGVRVISSGRVSWDEPDWQRGERLGQFEGGISNRLLLERYLAQGIRGVERHNGPAIVVVWDPRESVLHLLTDHFGYHPVFLYRPDDLDHAVISTFPDAIAGDPDVSVSRDLVAAAEFLSAWRVTPPHTYYKEIKYAGAATHWCWDFQKRSVTQRVYWKPYQEVPFPNIDVAAEELAAAVSHAVRIRTLPRLGPIVSYTSGGMDSRAVLFSAADPAQIIALNLYDVPNKEAAVSRRLAEASGARYHGFARDNDYYPRWLAQGARLSGAMWSAEDNHFLGTRELVKSFGAQTVTTACTTDWLFKGYGLEKTYARLLGRNLPIKVFTHERVNGFLPNIPRPVPAEFKKEVNARLEEWFEGTPTHLNTDADWLAVEDRRIRPACYAVSVSGQIMYRIFPYDTFLADKGVADGYSRCRAEWKINADLWGKAVRQICARGQDIEDSNFGWRIGSTTPVKLAMFAVGWVKRRINPPKFGGNGLATDGAWPNLGWYAQHSATLSEVWHSVPLDTRELISQAWGSNPWNIPLQEWANVPNDLFRILSLASIQR